MDYLLGFTGAICVSLVVFALIVSSVMQNMTTRMKLLEAAVERRNKRESYDDADQWKYGCQDEDDDEQLDSLF